MMCPRCNTLMLLSKAIYPKGDPNARTIVPYDRVLKADEVFLIECFKCPKCGHTDATRDQIAKGKLLMDKDNTKAELGYARIGSDRWNRA